MILLVEDEERAREVFARILRHAGYAVAEAKRVCAGCPHSCQMAQHADNSHVRLLVPRCSKDHDEWVGRIYTEAP